MRKLVVTLLTALAVMLPALTMTPAQATTQAVSEADTPATDPTADPTTDPTADPTADPSTGPTPEEQAAAEKAAAEQAAKDKAAKQKAAKEKAAKKRAAKKKAAAKARAKRERRAMATWNRLAHCESTSRWHVNTGNGYYGGLQISPSTWRAFGGRRYAGLPHQASKRQQVAIGKAIKNGQGWGAWPSCSRRLGLR